MSCIGSLLATLLVGPTNPHVLLAFGAGKQIEAHVDLFVRQYESSLRKVIIVNRSVNARLLNLRKRLQSNFPEVQFSAEGAIDGVGLEMFDLQHAVLSADIICTATSSSVPLFRSEWLKIGTHINLVGSYKPTMHEVDVGVVQRAGVVLVDSRHACLEEAGELIGAGIGPGALIEVGEIVDEDGKGDNDTVMMLRGSGDITLFKSVGIGLQDTAIAQLVVQKATGMGMGVHVPYEDSDEV